MTARLPIAIALAGSMACLASTSRDPQRPSSPAYAQEQTDATGSPPSFVPFASNGCSGFREARFFTCCFVHDLAFWAGGTWSDRNQADLTLRRCILSVSGHRILADLGYFLVRLGTLPGLIIDDGWGRAWRQSKRSRYAALTPEQRQHVVDEKQRVCQALELNPKTGRYRTGDTREIRFTEARQICGGDPPVRR